MPEADDLALLADTEETAANIRDQVSGWTLPPGQSAVVLAPGGHLSIVHTSALEGWARQVEQLRLALVASRETAARLNRRAQQAEAVADRFVASREQGARGRSLGRALANYAAARLAAVAREAIEGWAASARCEGACQHEECAPSAALRARLDVLTGGGERATVAGMATPLPTLERLGYAYYLRRRAPDAPTWDRLTPAQQSGELSAVRWVLDTAYGEPGDGAIYAASPGSPPPTEPAP